jgi:hypothetical protein
MHLQKETHPMACQTTKIQQKKKSMDVKNYSFRTMFLKPRKRNLFILTSEKQKWAG